MSEHPNPAFALLLVQQLHQARTYPDQGTVCAECRQVWPCHTVRVIEGAGEFAAQPAVGEATEPDPDDFRHKPRKKK